jgi:hypothetical protein
MGNSTLGTLVISLVYSLLVWDSVLLVVCELGDTRYVCFVACSQALCQQRSQRWWGCSSSGVASEERPCILVGTYCLHLQSKTPQYDF